MEITIPGRDRGLLGLISVDPYSKRVRCPKFLGRTETLQIYESTERGSPILTVR